MNISSFRAYCAPSPRTASALLLAALLSCLQTPLVQAAPKGGSGGDGGGTPSGSTDHRIAIGPQTTPGDDDATPSLYKITAPGSYYLTASVVGVAGKSGIEIASSHVTLDLNGHALEGVAGSLRGIEIANGANHVAVRNGKLTGWGSWGINGQYADGSHFEQLTLTANFGTGLITGPHAVVTDCTVTGHEMAPGVFTWGPGAVLTRVVAYGNGTGIRTYAATLVDCVAENNQDYGFELRDESTLIRCVARENVGPGFSGPGNFTGCLALSNAHGFSGSGVFTACGAHDNDSEGFALAPGSVVTASKATNNGRHGILLREGGRASDNNAHNNGRDPALGNGAGIYVQTGSALLIENNSTNNPIGMFVAGVHSRIEGNNFANNTVADLKVTGQYNLIIRNTARMTAGVNWEIAANNRAGAFVAPALNGAISASTGGNGSGTTDPFANLSF